MPFPAGAPANFQFRFALKYDTDGIPLNDLSDYPKAFTINPGITAGACAALAGIYLDEYDLFAVTGADEETSIPFFWSIGPSVGNIGTYTPSVTSNVFTFTSHGLDDGNVIYFSDAPTGLSNSTNYWVINTTADTYQVSATRGGSAITGISDDGSTTHARRVLEGQVRVRLNLLTAATVGDEFCWLYLGDSADGAVDEQDEPGTYHSDCEARYGWASNANDSTGNNNDGTAHGGASTSGGTLTLDGTDDDIETGITFAGTSPLAVLWVWDTPAPEASFSSMFSSVNGSGANCYLIGIPNSSPNAYSSRKVDNNLIWTTGGGAAVDFFAGQHSYAYTHPGGTGTAEIFFDGASVDTEASMQSADCAGVYIGLANAGNMGGGVGEVQFWLTARSDDWIAYFHIDELTNADTFTVGTLEEDTGATYTLAIDGGTYTETGAVIALKHGWELPIGGGSYTETGAAVNLLHGWELALDTGTYTLTGDVVSLLHSWELVVGSGTYTETGASVGLLHGWELPIAADTYTLTGSNITLLHGWELAIGLGSYSLTGGAVGLLHGWELSVGSGTYTLTGSDITLTYTPGGGGADYTLAIDTGSYTLSGSVVGIQHGWELPIGDGSYTLTGSSITLLHGWELLIGSGSYTLSGADIDFDHTWSLTIGAGSYTLTGSSVTLTYSGVVILDRTRIVINTTDARLVVDTQTAQRLVVNTD